VYRIGLAPGEHVDTHDALVVPLTAVNLTNPPGQPLRLFPGMVNDTHSSLTNGGPSDARFILLEFGEGRTQSNRPVEQSDSAASTRPGGAFK
jgi:hypothetical protein